MATDYSGDQLFFTTELSQSGAGQPTYGKLFVVDRQGLRPFLILDRVETVQNFMGPRIVTNFYDIDGVDLSSNGAVLAVMSLRTCALPYIICQNAVQSTLWNERGEVTLTAKGRIIVSHNGRWGLAVEDPLTGPFTEFTLYDLASGSQTELPSVGLKDRDWRRHGVANDGTVMVATESALQFYRRNQKSKIPMVAGRIGSAVLSADGAFVVWEESSSGHSSLRSAGNSDDSPVALLTPSGWSDDQPHISDDGSRILFRSGPADASDPQLYLMNGDGSGRRPVSAVPEGIAKAVFSGNGQVAWALTRTGKLIQVDVDTGATAQFTGPLAAFLRPTFVFNSESRPSVDGPPGQVLDLPASVMPGEKVEVTIDDGSQVLPVWANVVEPQSVRVQIPWEARFNPGTLLRLPRLTIRKPESPSWSGNTFDVQFSQIRPRFTLAVHDADDTSITPQQPAHGGEIIQVFGTGFGPVDPSVADGEAAPTNPLSYLVNPITCRTEAADVPVLFAGLAPGRVGIYRIDLRLPDVLPQKTDSFTVQCTIGSFEGPALISIPRTF